MSTRQCMSRFFACLIALSLFSLSSPGWGDVDFVLDVRPGAILVGGGGTFKAVGEVTVGNRTVTLIEKMGGVSTFPNLKLGLGVETPATYWDFTGGGGVMINDPFRSYHIGVDAAFQYKYRKNAALGPHVGLLYFAEPEWTGDADLVFSDSWGAMMGVQMTLGYDILFIFSLDYLYTNPFDVTARGIWDVSDGKNAPGSKNAWLDLSGFALQFGMRGRF